MIAWRITTPERVSLDGEEAREQGGRWHSAGRPLVYAASSCALATLEFLAHLDGDPPGRLVAMQIEIPDAIPTDSVKAGTLAPDWRTPEHADCRTIGDRWLERAPEDRAAVLLVPSAVIPFEHNVLIDPQHGHADEVRIAHAHDYRIDHRLL